MEGAGEHKPLITKVSCDETSNPVDHKEFNEHQQTVADLVKLVELQHIIPLPIKKYNQLIGSLKPITS